MNISFFMFSFFFPTHDDIMSRAMISEFDGTIFI